MEETTTDADISINKTVSTEKQTVQLTYRICAADVSGESLRLVKRFSHPIDHAHITVLTGDTGHWNVRSDREVVFTAEQLPAEPVETTVSIRWSTAAADTAVPPRTTLTTEFHTAAPDSQPTAEPSVPKGPTGPTDSETVRIATDGGTRETNGEQRNLSGGQQAIPAVGSKTHHKRPAVGVAAATPSADGADISPCLSQAVEKGLGVYVAVSDTTGPTADLARRVGATVVETAPTAGRDEQATRLLQAAWDDSYPGLIVCEPHHKPVDLSASLTAFTTTDRLVLEGVSATEQLGVLVGIPAYNEAGTIAQVVRAASAHADEVLVVDDGSTDQTARRAREAGATVVEHGWNRGYGRGIKTLFEEADRRDAEALVILDGDGQHDASDIPRLVAAQRESGAELVIGNRFGETAATEIPLYRRLGLWVITSLLNVSLGNFRSATRIQDAQSGFRLYDTAAIRSVVSDIGSIDDGMSASTDLLYHAHARGFQTVEIPTTISYDVSNASTHHPVRHGLGLVNRILTRLVQKRPVTLIGIPGVALFAVGVALGYWTLSAYLTNGSLVAESVILSVVLVVSGCLSLVVSAVHHAVNASLDGYRAQ